MTSDLPNLQDIKAEIEDYADQSDDYGTGIRIGKLRALVAALEAVIENCRTIALSNYSQPAARDQAQFTLRKIREHLDIGDTE